MPYILDIETNGLLDELTKIHCLVLRDTETNEVFPYGGDTSVINIYGNSDDGIRVLQQLVNEGHEVIGHNLIDFDIPAIKKVYPWFTIPESQVVDTLVLSRLIYPDRWDADKKLVKTKNFPKKLMNKHSLEAWGHRLGDHKGEYEGDPRIEDVAERKRRKWESWNPDMEEYCIQDTQVTLKLYKHFLSLNYSPEAIQLEHDVRWIIAEQERYGFAFNVQAAVKLYSDLTAEQLQLEAELRSVFPPKYLRDGKTLTPKKDLKSRGYIAGAPFTKVVRTLFSASNRNHITWWLKLMYGWEPTEFGNDGKPKMDETVLESLKYPEVEKLKKYLVVDKRISQLATGNEAWLKHEKNGRIHGRCNSNGAVTGRATHSSPNLGQVPSVEALFGERCRTLFTVSPGKVLVGADLSGLELRCLAHYMGLWDGGEYGKILLEGDIHEANRVAAGLPTRSMSKTFIYGFLLILKEDLGETPRLKLCELRETPERTILN